MQPLGTKQNQATSQDNKITQYVGQKYHATSWDKNLTLSITKWLGLIRSKGVQMGP